MKIGIMGAGHIGGTLTNGLTELGHRVFVANSRGPESLTALAAETDAIPARVPEIPLDKDVIILTIPLKNVPTLPKGLLDAAPPDAVIIDTCNYYPKYNGRIDAIEDGMTESQWVQLQLGRPVIKAFNSITAAHLWSERKPVGTQGRIALPIAGDDPRQKAIVMELVNAFGFDPLDAGQLEESWRQQPGKPCFIADLSKEALPRALAEASPERSPDWRA